MTAALALLIGGVVAATIIIVAWMRKPRVKDPEVDPIAVTTGSNRTLTGAKRALTGSHPAAAGETMSWNEALRRLVAYALDDSPREALSQPPNPDHAPVFQAVQ